MIITHNLRYTLAHHGIRACLRGRNPIDNANHAARNVTHLCEASTLKPVLLRHTQELGEGGIRKCVGNMLIIGQETTTAARGK